MSVSRSSEARDDAEARVEYAKCSLACLLREFGRYMEQSRVAIVPLDAEHDVASLIDVDLARVAHHDLDREIFIVNVNQDTLHGGNVDSVVRHFVTLIFWLFADNYCFICDKSQQILQQYIVNRETS